MNSYDDLQIKQLLNHEWQLLLASITTLKLSVERCRSIGQKIEYSFMEQESFDSLTSKFNRSSDIYIQKVLRTAWSLLHEEFLPLIDFLNRMEKFGMINRQQELAEIRDLRNTITHEYLPEAIIKLVPEVLHYTTILESNIAVTQDFLMKHRWLTNETN